MAIQPDLVAQKILNTDPQIGFGQGDVLPYHRRELDTRGLDAIERANTRKDMQEEARKKAGEDHRRETLKNLPVYEKEFDKEGARQRNQVVSNAYADIARTGKVSEQTQKDLLSHVQYAEDTKRLKKELESVDNMVVSDDISKESLQSAAAKKYRDIHERSNAGDTTATNESVMPDVNDPQHFKFDKYYHDLYGNRKATDISVDEIRNGALGQEITTKKTSANFVTKDKNGKDVPGIDQSVIDANLYSETTDPKTLRFRNAIFSLADKKIQNKALELYHSNDPRYADMTPERITEVISTNPSDQNYREYNRKKVAEDIDRNKTEQFQKVSVDNGIRSGHAYPQSKGGSGNSQDEINARHVSLQKILSGDETEQGNIVGGKYGGKNIVGVKFVPNKATGAPVNKSSEKGAMAIKDEGGTVEFKILGARNKEESIDIPYKSKKELYYLMNNVYNTAAGQNKISNEELNKNRGNDKIVDEPKTLSADDIADTSELIPGEKYSIKGKDGKLKTYKWDGTNFI